MSYHIISYHIISYHISHIISYHITAFEGVCVTTVILAPGVRRRGGPSRHFDTTSLSALSALSAVSAVSVS